MPKFPYEGHCKIFLMSKIFFSSAQIALKTKVGQKTQKHRQWANFTSFNSSSSFILTWLYVCEKFKNLI